MKTKGSTNRRQFISRSSKALLAGMPLVTMATEGRSKRSKIDLPDIVGERYWQAVRMHFPLEHNRVYFNSGTFGPSPYMVLESIINSLNETNSIGEYGQISEIREGLARFVNAESSEICLTHNTTEGLNIVIWGLPLREGDEVIISSHEHVGHALPWLNRAKLDGIVLKPFQPARTANENVDRIKALITSRTRVIAVPHISCTTGLKLPVEEICMLARERNIFSLIDGAHGPGSINLDMGRLNCDFYAAPCHKWMLGPNGSGFLYISEPMLDKLQAYHVGASSDIGWDLNSTPPKLYGYADSSNRFDFGSQSRPLYLGAMASAEFHNHIGKIRIEERIRELGSYLYNGLNEFADKIEILTPSEAKSRHGIITFRPNEVDYRTFNQGALKNGFRLRVVPESNLNAIRVSTHIYNSFDEIDSFLEYLKLSV